MVNNNKLASLCILTYNQIDYIEDAVKAAFNQTYSPLEIIISDDGSTDGTYEKIQELANNYKGAHEIVLNHNITNLGIREHVNKVLYDIAKGEYLIMAAGDDISSYDRVAVYVEYFERFPEVMSISCLSEEIDEKFDVINKDGLWNYSYSIYGLADYIFLTSFVMTSGDSRGLRRKVIESFDRLEDTRDEDIFLFIRSLLLGSVCYLHRPLVKRRITGNNTSKNHSTKMLLDSMDKQLKKDIQYAKSQEYITNLEYKKMMIKEKYIMEHFWIYTVSPRKYPKSFFYRALRKGIKLTKYFPPIDNRYNDY